MTGDLPSIAPEPVDYGSVWQIAGLAVLIFAVLAASWLLARRRRRAVDDEIAEQRDDRRGAA